jgi:Rrf2 family protein
MFKLYSQKCAYVLQALSSIPLKKANETFTATSLCQQADVPESITRKALQTLSQAGYLETVTGPTGGYKFKKAPKNITVLEIISVIEGKDSYDQCIMGLAQCHEQNPCPMHTMWMQMKGCMFKTLEGMTLEHLLKIKKIQLKKKGVVHG